METFPKRSTLVDVAREAEVSVATASRALSGRGSASPATVARVHAAAEMLGYVVDAHAASLVTGRSRAIAVLIPDLGRWFFGEVLSGVRSELSARGYDLMLIDSSASGGRSDALVQDHGARQAHVSGRVAADAPEHRGRLPRARFDGIIAVGIDPGDEDDVEILRRSPVPRVSIGATDLGSSSVSIDDQAAARIATEHLIRLGHRDIACVGGDPEEQRRSSGDALRVAGYREAMVQAGLAEQVRHVPCEPRMPGGHRIAAQLLGDRRDRPTALVGVCDEVAIGAIVAARQLGYAVPGELSVVGIDDHEHAEMFALTTVKQRPRWQGAQAVELLLEQLEGAAVDDAAEVSQSPLGERRITDETALIVRASTGKLK